MDKLKKEFIKRFLDANEDDGYHIFIDEQDCNDVWNWIAENLTPKVSRVELPVRREIYDRLLYYCWCVRFEKDEDFMLTKTHDAYQEFLEQTETHDGDCTLQAVSCPRCHLQACEIEAQKLYNYLYGK